VIVLLVIAGVAAGTWFFQERITFQPQRPPFPSDSGLNKVTYRAADGVELFAYIVGASRYDGPLLIAFHGNADLAVRQIGWAEEIVHLTGIPVMIAEYRGYMGLAGRPTYEGSKLDAEAAYRYATDHLKSGPASIVFFGHSLGTAIATELAVVHRPAALLLQSPFTSARDMATLIAGKPVTALTWRFVSRVHFDTVRGVSSLDVPVSVAHGGRDRVIPSRMGRQVYESAKIKGEWLFVPAASHSDVPLRAGGEYWQWITSALKPVTRR
jgi:fermentation-respiration switch protein FrsA (DUF1100 family)